MSAGTIILAAMVGAGLGVIVWGLRPLLKPAAEFDPMQARLEYYGAAKVDETDILHLSFRERIIEPQLARLMAAVNRLAPLNYQRRLDAKLDAAGRPFDLGAVDYIVVRAAGAALGGIVGVAIGGLFGRPEIRLLMAVGLGTGVWVGGGMWLQSRIRARQREVLVALPNLIDFLVISVVAGLSLDGALTRVVARYRNPLTAGLSLALAEVKLGRPRLEALDAFARKSGVDEVNGFIQAVISSDRMGVPIAEVLRTQSEAARWRRSNRARELGAKAPIKMMVPMVLFIFPTIWLILLGPALFQIFRAGI